MKRLIAISIAVVSILAWLVATDLRPANAQNQVRPVRDTGIITLGTGQKVRVSVALGDITGDDEIRIRFRKIEYGPDVCSGGVCKKNVISQATSAQVTLTRETAASFTCIPEAVYGVRVVVLGNSPAVNANAWVIDNATGLVQSGYDDEEMGMLN